MPSTNSKTMTAKPELTLSEEEAARLLLEIEELKQLEERLEETIKRLDPYSLSGNSLALFFFILILGLLWLQIWG